MRARLPSQLARAGIAASGVALTVGAAVALAAPGTITTVAGTGSGVSSGDGHPAVFAGVSNPTGVAPLPGGGYLIAESGAARIRRVSRGTITTVAGNGTYGYGGDNGPATSAELKYPYGVAPLPGGGYLIADAGNNRIRKVSPAGKITTVAGTGSATYNGDNIPATAAALNFPESVALLPGGAYLISDSGNNRIRKVSAAGTITTVAGNGSATSGGDNGAATSAGMNSPWGVTPLPGGGFLIAEQGSNRIRKVSAGGTITTVAGNGAKGYNGDNKLATSAELAEPTGITLLPHGGYLIADQLNERIRKVSQTGTITTVAGTGAAGFGGDNGPAIAAEFSSPDWIALLPDGGYLIAEFANNRIRRVEGFAPGATITKHPKAKLKTKKHRVSVSFRFRSTEANSTFQCQLDQGSFRPCVSPGRYKVKAGRHTFRVRATNQFGRTGAVAKFRFKVVRRKG